MDIQAENMNEEDIREANVAQNLTNEDTAEEYAQEQNTAQSENCSVDSRENVPTEEDIDEEVSSISQQAERQLERIQSPDESDDLHDSEGRQTDDMEKDSNNDENNDTSQRPDSELSNSIREMEAINLNESQVESPVPMDHDGLASKDEKNYEEDMDVDPNPKESEDTLSLDDDRSSAETSPFKNDQDNDKTSAIRDSKDDENSMYIEKVGKNEGDTSKDDENNTVVEKNVKDHEETSRDSTYTNETFINDKDSVGPIDVDNIVIDAENTSTVDDQNIENSRDVNKKFKDDKENSLDGDKDEDSNSTTKPDFLHIDTEKEDNDKSTCVTEQDEVAVDPIGDSTSDWTQNNTMEQDDDECIIPDSNRSENQEGEAATGSEENVEWKGKYVVNISNGESEKSCMICSKKVEPKYKCSLERTQTFLCSEVCLKQLKDDKTDKVIVRDLRVKNLYSQSETAVKPEEPFVFRRCAECSITVNTPAPIISWESLEFCKAGCISKYQNRIGSTCSSCKRSVLETSLGKYCVRFGYHIRQFCTSACLLKYKKGFKVCSYCQNEIVDNTSINGFLANIGDKGQFRDFCSLSCMDSYTALKQGPKLDAACAVCHKVKKIVIKYCDAQKKDILFCGEPCFVAFKYVNNISPLKCEMCLKFYPTKSLPFHIVGDDNTILRFCSNTCENVYINIHRKIVSCAWCKVKKYNFDMVQKLCDSKSVLVCSLLCLQFTESSNKAGVNKKLVCSNCYKVRKMNFHIAVDNGMKNFCTYQCVQEYQSKQNPRLRIADMQSVPTIVKRVTRKSGNTATTIPSPASRKQIIPDVPGPLPIITSVRSLAPTSNSSNTESSRNLRSQTVTPEPQPPPVVTHIVIVKPPDLPDVGNVMTMVKPITVDEETHIKPDCADKETQTEGLDELDIEVLPIPIYIPQPIHSYSFPYIKPLPFPLPVPVPILMPLTKKTANGILKEVKSAQPTPSDPYEADLLVMAELVADANEKDNQEEQAPESDPEDIAADAPSYSPEPPEQNASFGDDVLQMALNMESDFAEPAVDLEGALTANTITATAALNEQPEEVQVSRPPVERTSTRGRRRGRGSRGRGRGRGRPSLQQEPAIVQESVPETPPEPVEKPDANMCLKYTFGINAWKQWVTNKNTELEKSSRRVKLFKTDLLQLTSDELNYSLCLFVKEVRKPNGAEYAPDTIYYLCLGIQQYLFENGRIDNIFCDPYYETFTDCLDEICKKFSTLYNDSQYIVTRVEEEHLWESKQLGAHSPHVLLTTLMFFNTKHFNLTNVDEHMQLSFSHIMKHWKRVPSTSGTSKNSSSRNILLRFYPPQSAVEGNRKKKVYEQQENEENPIRCPVKLYEFYLSKCPESVKTRNDVFYLLPERSCVPDSPVWYSTMALGKEPLEKMLHRVKMVKEINVALLAS